MGFNFMNTIQLGNLTLQSNIFLAPLAGFTNYAYRLLCYELGAGLCFTEMTSGNGLKYKDESTRKILFTNSLEKIKAAQIVGANPYIMESISCSEYFNDFDIIDINMGCPVPTVIKNGEGCALLLDLKRASKIIEGCKKSGKIITVKTRVGMSPKNLDCAEFVKMCEQSGADMVTIHGRTRNMMYDGEPLYEQIAIAKSYVKIPIIANGGICSMEDAKKMMDLTLADGVMIGRHALENPFIFCLDKKPPYTKNTFLKNLIHILLKYYDEHYTLSYMKKIIPYFMKKLIGTKKYKSELFCCGTIQQLLVVIDKIFDEVLDV